jgi:hypothetical protein
VRDSYAQLMMKAYRIVAFRIYLYTRIHHDIVYSSCIYLLAPMSKQSTPRDVAIVQPKAHDAHSSATVPVAHSAVGGAGRRDDGRVPDRTVIVRPSSAKGTYL